MVNAITVHLIRHEKTQANVNRQYIGRTDEPILQAHKRQMTHEPKVVYTSEKIRTKETAKLYFEKVEFIPLKGFNEIDFGDFEMKTYEELQHNPQYRAWIDAPQIVTPPNGESFVAFQQRVLETFQQITQTSGTYTFVVHGGVIRVLLAHYCPDEQSFQQVRAQHHTQYTLNWTNVEDLKEGKRCTSFSEDFLMAKQIL